MKISKLHDLRFNLSLIVFLIAGLANAQQNRNTSTSRFILDEKIIGNAEYQYIINKKDTIKNGLFNFSSFSFDTITTNAKRAINLSGNYSNGVKNGKWTYSYKSLKEDKNFIINNYEIIYLSSGKEIKVSANFTNGKASGNWIVTEYSIKNSIISDTLLFLESNYTNGIPTGSLIGFKGKTKFSGNLNQEGLAHGEWIFHHNSNTFDVIKDYRFFENGLLKNHYLIIGEDTLSYIYVGLDNNIDEGETWEVTPFKLQYFKTLSSANIGIDSTKCQPKNTLSYIDTSLIYNNKSNIFLENSIGLVKNHNNVKFWDSTEGSESVFLPSVKLRVYDLDKQEEKNLNVAGSESQKAQLLIKNFFENANVAIDRHSDKKLGFLYSVMEEYREKISVATNLSQQFLSPEFKYINRSDFFDFNKKNLLFTGLVTFEYKNAQYKEPYSFPEFNEEEDYSLILRKYVTDIVADLNIIAKETETILNRSKKQSNLTEKEKILLQKKDSIIDLYSGNIEEQVVNNYHLAVSEDVIGYVNTMFADYAKMEFEEKMEFIDEYINCFSAFELLFEKQSEIPVKITRIDENYTRTIWNPYTFTDMQERVKERIYKAFENILLPYVIDEMKSNLNCSNIELKLIIFEKLYRKMIMLRDIDTKNIEKEIRRVKDPLSILKIIDLQLN